MPKIYLDTETVGLHGFPVLLQYAVEEGPITLHEIWRRPIRETLNLIEWLCENTVVGFNLVFDWFHIVKTYTTFRLANPDWVPEEHINELALLEPTAQDGPCVKPDCALDLLLHSRKGPMQSLMAREDVRIKRVPTPLAEALAEELEARVRLDDIYFAKSADPEAPRWQVYERRDRYGDIDTEFRDVVLRFNPAGGLKFLAEHVLKLKPKFHFKDVEPPTAWRPYELGYAPTALAVARPERNWEVWGRKKGKLLIVDDHDERDDDEIVDQPDSKLLGVAWPGVIQKHIEHWATHPDAREYANDDIVYTRALDHHFGDPTPGDDDSTLACMVAAVRWHGFRINIEGMKALCAEAEARVANAPVNINKPGEVRQYITVAMDDLEKVVIEDTTRKAKLEEIAKWEIDSPEPCCEKGCERCGGTGTLQPGKHPAAVRAKKILDVKIAAKEVELYQKLLHAGKFHASFNVIGALSSRMSGADGLNPQGIKHTKEVRRMFPLSWDGYILSLGDFSAFEVTIADAVCNDEALRAELLQGKKIHALFGMALFPGKTYEEIVKSSGTENDMYTKGKQGFFGTILYGGDHSTLKNKLGIPEETGKKAIEAFGRRYKGVKAWRNRINDSFCSMRQPDGIGKAVVWADPAEYVESFLGFRRYFTLENMICKTLFDLANKPPKHWKDVQVKVVRRDRVQWACGAVQSALFGAAFAIQAAAMRAAANHEIQSPGATITKAVQRKVWDLQPAGVHDFQVTLMNVHDEIHCVHRPSMTDKVAEVIKQGVESFRPKVPLIGMDWLKHAQTWADKL